MVSTILLFWGQFSLVGSDAWLLFAERIALLFALSANVMETAMKGCFPECWFRFYFAVGLLTGLVIIAWQVGIFLIKYLFVH